jgi:hypothetical protein
VAKVRASARPVAKALRGHRKAKSDQSAPKATVGLKACPEMQGSKARKASAVQGVWLESEASAERKPPIALPAETAPLARWDSEASAANKALAEATAQLDHAEKKAKRAMQELLDQSARAAKSDSRCQKRTRRARTARHPRERRASWPIGGRFEPRARDRERTASQGVPEGGT